jgi:hypothetical protein
MIRNYFRTVVKLDFRRFRNWTGHDPGEWEWPARQGVVLALISLVLVTQVLAAPTYPLKKSANGRYLVDQNNTPFLIIGDTAWSLIVNISEADAAVYFAKRQVAGFNVVMMDLICGTYTAGRSDSSTYDKITPFTSTIAGKSTYDLNTPRETYFTHVDRILKLAAAYGFTVFLDPLDTGSYYRSEGTPTMQDNGPIKCRAYGNYLGKRYKSFPNIVWQHGNDYDYPILTADGDQYTTAIALGIKDYDTKHIHTIELGAPSGSLNDPNWASIVSLDAAYTWSPTYAEVLTEYNRSSFLPVFVVEDHYEDEKVGWPPQDQNSDLGTPLVNRRQDYWTMTCGATGKLYGNHSIWTFSKGWIDHLNTQCISELGYMKALFAPRRWYDLMPDNAHTVVTSGYGTYAATGKVSENDYATAARTPDGSLVVVYLPTLRSITVDMRKLRGTVTARWYDPTNGIFSTASGSPFANSGSRNFTPPHKNSAGDGDWVLVLEV